MLQTCPNVGVDQHPSNIYPHLELKKAVSNKLRFLFVCSLHTCGAHLHQMNYSADLNLTSCTNRWVPWSEAVLKKNNYYYFCYYYLTARFYDMCTYYQCVYSRRHTCVLAWVWHTMFVVRTGKRCMTYMSMAYYILTCFWQIGNWDYCR
jgi:hypothetical protein